MQTDSVIIINNLWLIHESEFFLLDKDKQPNKFVQNSNFVIREIVGEYILVPIRYTQIDMDSFYSINQVAAFAWVCLEYPKSINELSNMVLNEFDVDKDTALHDIRELIENWIDNNIVLAADSR